jgi:thioredoxin 1
MLGLHDAFICIIISYECLSHYSSLISGCGPCRQIKPIFEELSGKYSDVAFGLVDVDENPDASMEFQIKAVPTFVSFDGEAQVESFSGADTTKLEAMVKSLQAR